MPDESPAERTGCDPAGAIRSASPCAPVDCRMCGRRNRFRRGDCVVCGNFTKNDGSERDKERVAQTFRTGRRLVRTAARFAARARLGAREVARRLRGPAFRSRGDGRTLPCVYSRCGHSAGETRAGASAPACTAHGRGVRHRNGRSERGALARRLRRTPRSSSSTTSPIRSRLLSRLRAASR